MRDITRTINYNIRKLNFCVPIHFKHESLIRNGEILRMHYELFTVCVYVCVCVCVWGEGVAWLAASVWRHPSWLCVIKLLVAKMPGRGQRPRL